MKTVRNTSAEDGFRREHNLVVTVEQGRELNPDKTFKQTTAVITSQKGNVYIIDEYLKGNLTDYVLVGEQRFNKYKTAEDYVAEMIRKE